MRIGSALRLLVTVFLLGCGAAAWAQSFDLDRGREAVVSLDGLWRFHPGDSPFVNGRPAWAAPDFDDSKWQLLKGGESWSDQGYSEMSGFAWYRFAVRVPAGSAPASLLLAPIVTSFRVYVDGTFAGGSGNMPPVYTPNTSFSFHAFPLTTSPSDAARTVEVAIRVWHSPMWASYMGGGPWSSGSIAGDSALIATELQHHETVLRSRMVDWYTYSVASGIVGLAILCLFLMRRREREYLWFALVVLAQSTDSALGIWKEVWAIPAAPVYDLLDAALNAVIFGAGLCFVARVLDVPLRKAGSAVFVLLAFSPLASVLYWPRLASAPESAALQLLLLLPTIVWPLFLLARYSMRGNRDAQLLLAPIFLASGYYALDNLVMLLSQAGLMHRPQWMSLPVRLQPFSVHIQVFLDLMFLLAMLVFLIRRFSLARKREERMSTEFEAARVVQQMLLPDALDQCPAYRVNSVYRPADEVGGDFFQQIADGSGGILIVVGDVSGKGLPAALIVSVLVGAIRAEAAHGSHPAQMLAALNDRMMQRMHGGFVTCIAAHLSAEGMLTIANAGHLPPYLNGDEMAVTASLPLGLIPGARYETTAVQLQPDDRLTFVSDGVVEAQTKAGELFGFERTRALSGQAAEQIASTAQAFGQEDDITVVTVNFCGEIVAEQDATAGARTQLIEPDPATA